MRDVVTEGREPPGRVGRWDRHTDGAPPCAWCSTRRRTARGGCGRSGARTLPGAPAGDCLLFDAGEVVRRVWGAPLGWPALSDAALLALVAAPPGRARAVGGG